MQHLKQLVLRNVPSILQWHLFIRAIPPPNCSVVIAGTAPDFTTDRNLYRDDSVCRWDVPFDKLEISTDILRLSDNSSDQRKRTLEVSNSPRRGLHSYGDGRITFRVYDLSSIRTLEAWDLFGGHLVDYRTLFGQMVSLQTIRLHGRPALSWILPRVSGFSFNSSPGHFPRFEDLWLIDIDLSIDTVCSLAKQILNECTQLGLRPQRLYLYRCRASEDHIERLGQCADEVSIVDHC